MAEISPISGFTTAAQARVLLLQSGQLVHAPADKIGLQPLDATLTAFAGLDGTAGMLVQTGADAFARRRLTAPAAGLSISNPAGTAGNPTFALANDLAALEALASAGLAVRTAADAWALRAITGTANQITVTNGDGAAGNPVLSLPVGNIVAGSWTPTITNLANLDSSTAQICYYIRVGPHVMCWGSVALDPTAAGNAATSIGISLPIASNFAAATDLSGTATCGVAQNGGRILADTTNKRADLLFGSERTAAFIVYFTFGYVII